MERIDPIYCIAAGDPKAAKALAAKYNVPCTDDVTSIYNALKTVSAKPGGLIDIYHLNDHDARSLVNRGLQSNFTTEELAEIKTEACKLSLDELKARRENLVNTAAYARFNSAGKQDLDQQIAIIDECITIKSTGAAPPPPAPGPGSMPNTASTPVTLNNTAKLETGLKIAMVCVLGVLVLKGLLA